MPWDKLLQALTFDFTTDQLRAICRFSFRAIVATHILFACGYLAVFGLAGFARATDNESLKQSVAALRNDFARVQAVDRVDKLESELNSIDQELFLIRAKLSELGALGQRADSLYTNRQITLESKRGLVLRQLEDARDHPLLQPPSS